MQGGSAARLHLFTTHTANREGQKRRHSRYSCLGSLFISDGFARHQDKNEPFNIQNCWRAQLFCTILRDSKILLVFGILLKNFSIRMLPLVPAAAKTNADFEGLYPPPIQFERSFNLSKFKIAFMRNGNCTLPHPTTPKEHNARKPNDGGTVARPFCWPERPPEWYIRAHFKASQTSV